MTGSERRDVAVLMRDGVRLSADLYLPDERLRPCPAVVYRTPYGKQRDRQVRRARVLARRGYAVVLQDVRGRHDSDGSWVPFRNEGLDGFDTVEWAAEQPWCSGGVATMGGSYSGWCQWALAAHRPPHLVTMVSTATSGRWGQENPIHNGCVMLVMLAWLEVVGRRVVQVPGAVDWGDVFRHLPLRDMDLALGRDLPVWREWVAHPALDGYWTELRVDRDLVGLDLPVLHITGWYDADQPGSLHFYRAMMQSSPNAHQQLVVGPWDHAGASEPRAVTGGVDFGPTAVLDMEQLHAEWFDRWLCGSSAGEPASRVRYFATGSGSWRQAEQWPPAGRAVNWYLHNGGRLATELPGDAPASSFLYDPGDPVPSAVDSRFYSPDQQETPLDRRFQLDRNDVLTWSTEPVDQLCSLAGHPILHLYACSDGPDTDWFASVHDVAPDGTHLLLCEGRLRARFHASPAQESLLEPGVVYEFVIELTALGHDLRPGHCLRLALTSSDFPTWDRNLNTGRAIGQDDEQRVATNTVHHDRVRASYLQLPVVAAGPGFETAPRRARQR